MKPLTFGSTGSILVYEVWRNLFDNYFSNTDLALLRLWIEEEQERRSKETYRSLLEEQKKRLHT